MPKPIAGLGELALKVSRSRVQSENAATGPSTSNIIDFIESPWGLNSRPFPAQRVIIKAFYGIPLEEGRKTVPITNWRRENERVYSEADYLRMLYDEGRSNVREVKREDAENRRELVLAVGRRSGKCILGDSLVLTGDGLFKIEDLRPAGNGGPDSSSPLEVVVAQAGDKRAVSSHFYNGGVKPVRIITTRCGYKLGGTDNHRIQVMSSDGVVQWKYVSDLVEGDHVALHRGTDLWSSKYVDCAPFRDTGRGTEDVLLPEVLDERWGLLLGCLVGDRSWTKKTGIHITIEDPEMWDCMWSLFRELLGEPFHYSDKRTSNTGTLQFHSRSAKEFLNRLGYNTDATRHNKEIPWSILRSPRTVVASFLRGLFETDGCAEDGGKSVTFSTASRKLAEQVQVLLLNMGIVSSRLPKYIPGCDHTYWTVRILGTNSRRIFTREIGFLTHRKQSRLESSFSKNEREGSDTEDIPNQVGWCRRLLSSIPVARAGAGWSGTLVRKSLGNCIRPHCDESLTYPHLSGFLDAVKSLDSYDKGAYEHLSGLLGDRYFFDPVVSIEESEAQVWDLCVPDGHAFVANGVINHNTEMSAWMASHAIRELLKKSNPQRYYGISQGDNIKICAVATSKDQASVLYEKAKAYFLTSPAFSPYRANVTGTFTKFQSQYDIDTYGRWDENNGAQSSINATFYSCVAKGLRGSGNVVIILDEIAHFTNSGQSSASSVYKAVTPSTAAFSPKDPDDTQIPVGPSDGRIILISSPLGKDGFFYEKFRQGFGRPEHMLCIQAPTWEINPTIDAADLEREFHNDASSFFTEFGAEFSDRTRGWIEREEDLRSCIDYSAPRIYRSPGRRPHFLGIDIGVTKGGDGTAVAVGHIERDQRIALDYLELVRAGEGEHLNLDRLDFDWIADWILDISKRFYIAEGILDRWSGIPLEQAIHKRGLKQIESKHFTPPETTFMYKTFKDMMYAGRLKLYNWEPDGENSQMGRILGPEEGLCSYLAELMTLQEEKISRNVSIIQAPRAGGKHDDQSDALIRMVWLASQKSDSPKYISGGYGSMVGDDIVPARSDRMRFRRNALLGGSHPSRQRRKV